MNQDLRIHTFKTPLNDSEVSALRRLCTEKGVQCAPFVRSLINAATSSHSRRRETKREWPRHGHVPRCPSRATFGGAVRPLRV